MRDKSLLLASLVGLLILSVAAVNVNGRPTTRIYLNPSTSTAKPGGSFTIDVGIADVEGLYGYQFYLKWNASLLNVTKVVEGPFLNAEDAYETFFTRKINNTEGLVRVWCTLQGEPATAAARGSGTLATITFLVKAEGRSVLELYETELRTYEGLVIPHEVEGGYFTYSLPKLYLDPPSIVDPTLLPGSSFMINVSVVDVAGLYAWGFSLGWNPYLLNVTGVIEGPFLRDVGTTLYAYEVHQDEGYLYINCTLTGQSSGASGGGTLAVITFLVEEGGESYIDLYDTLLIDYGGTDISHRAESGYIDNLLHDVAVVDVEVSPNTVRAGDSISVTVTVKNNGTVTETFDVAVYYNGRSIGTKPVYGLESGAERTLTFSWSTQGVAEGDYTIRAEAGMVPGEANTGNNVYVYGTISVKPPEQSFPTTLIVAVMVAVAIVVGVVFYMRRRP